MSTVAPILDLIEFHKCLGPMGDLPPTVRLIIGSAAIIGGVVLIKVGQGRKKKGVPREKTAAQESTPEQTEEGKRTSNLSGTPEGKASGDGSEQQVAPEHREPDRRFFSGSGGKQ